MSEREIRELLRQVCEDLDSCKNLASKLVLPTALGASLALGGCFIAREPQQAPPPEQRTYAQPPPNDAPPVESPPAKSPPGEASCPELKRQCDLGAPDPCDDYQAKCGTTPPPPPPPPSRKGYRVPNKPYMAPDAEPFYKTVLS